VIIALRLLLAVLVPIVLIGGCPRTSAPPPIAEKPPTARTALPADASPAELRDRRIADLQGQLEEAIADRELANKREREAEDRAWRRWTRWIAAVAIPLAIAGAGVGLWLGIAKLALPIAGAVIAAALALQLWGEAIPYLVWALPALLLAGIAAAAVAILRRDQVIEASAKLADTLERGDGFLAVQTAKAEAWATQAKAGVLAKVARVRGKQPKTRDQVAA